MKRSVSVLAFVAVTPVVVLVGQGQPDQKPLAFEVASVKPNTSGDRRASLQMNLPDSFTATNQTLQSLVSLMYQVPVFKITGAPTWFATDRFDIAGKADHRLTFEEKREMMQALLEDRFKLKTHRETHEGRTYVLTFVNADHHLGPDIKPSRYDCAAILAARQRGESTSIPPPTPGEPPACGAFVGPQYRARGVQMSAFATTLSAMMRETVVDDTGLQGWWDFDVALNFTGFAGPPVGAVSTSDTPSIFTSLQEQLGLKLDTRRGLVETFVIEHIERLTPD